MDLDFTEAQQAAGELAATILADTAGHDVLRALERGTDDGRGARHWPRDAWSALAEAGLLGVGLPTDVGGGGLGFCETLTLIEQVARAAAPLPVFASLVLGALPISRFGSAEQRARWLPGVVDGSRILTGALVGADETGDPPMAGIDGDRFVSGEAWYVPFGRDADAVVVPIRMGDGATVVGVLDLSADGIDIVDLAPMSGEPSVVLRCDHVSMASVDVLDASRDPGVDAVGWWRDRAIAATCVAQAGTCAGALALTASYVSSREQFGVKLATLQAVSQRAADAWIDTETVRLTAWAAAWRLHEGLDATDELAVAKFFGADAAQRVVAAAQHLHGGIGMDLDYPIHRYFRWAKDHEQRLGGGAEHLAALGERIAST